MSSTPALEAEGLEKSYGDVRAVQAIDLAVPVGSVLGFLGPNGAGKTTAIRMLSTILRPDAGRFSVAGIPSTRPREIRSRIGVLPESTGYPAAQTGQEWLTYHGELFGRPRTRARDTAARLLAEVGLADRAGSLLSTYSRGMRQRLGVARALVNDPELVILDEPTLGLDPAGQRQLLDLVARIVRERGTTVIISTHLLHEVETSCDRIVILNRGRVVAQGSVTEVVRLAAAPRRAVLRVPRAQRERAVSRLAEQGVPAELLDGDRGGDLRLTLPGELDDEAASARILASLLEADLTVLGFTMEGGRLSDAFLAVTAEAP
jgi:ABC-2 type transport system ATP-binding protein